MKKIFSLLLVLSLVLGCLPVFSFRASADEAADVTDEVTEPSEEPTEPENPTEPEEPTEPENPAEPEEPTEPEEPVEYITSADCIDVIKSFEGFSKYPYYDNGQYTVGYGTKCPADKYTYYVNNGITEQEAEALLRSHISGVEAQVNSFNLKHKLYFTQNEFDAIVCFSYNCGTAWLYKSTGSFLSAVLEGKTGNDFIQPITLWCNAGGSPLVPLINRRLCEANMYLNGVYSDTPPANYCYVIYNGNGGSTTPRVQGYDANLTAEIITTPTREGYDLTGWYTSGVGGIKVEVLDAVVKGRTLYAHWVTSGEEIEPEPEITGVVVTVTNNSVNLRSGPGTGYSIIGTANTGDLFIITETATGSGYTWGKYDGGGWICLKYTNYDEVIAQLPSEPEDPETDGDGSADTEEEPPNIQKPTTLMGTVKVSSVLRIRSGPGTDYGIVGELKNGVRVEILEQTLVGNVTWGRIEKGWISMAYVVLDPIVHTCPEGICTECGTIKAEPGQTVKLSSDLTLAALTIPAGVILDLNGFTLTAAVTSFGDVIDSVGSGGLVTERFISSGNSYLPIYDSTKACYRFYACQLKNVGKRQSGTQVVFGFAPVFTNKAAYTLLQTTEDPKLDISVTLSWDDNLMSLDFTPELLRSFAQAQLKFPKLQAALMLTATGVDALADGEELNVVFSVSAADSQIVLQGQPMVYTHN